MNENALGFPDWDMQRYFDALPHYIQETIMQSGAHPKTVEELMDCANGLLD